MSLKNPKMEIAVAADRDAYIEAISTVSPYDDQHTEAAKFCFQRKVGSMKGLSSMYIGTPPGVHVVLAYVGI